MAAAPHQHEDSQLCACSFLAEPRVRGLLRVITLCCSSCEKRVPVSCRRSLSEHTLAALKDPTTYGLVEGVWYCWNAVIAGYESHMLACIFDVDSSQLSVALAEAGLFQGANRLAASARKLIGSSPIYHRVPCGEWK